MNLDKACHTRSAEQASVKTFSPKPYLVVLLPFSLNSFSFSLLFLLGSLPFSIEIKIDMYTPCSLAVVGRKKWLSIATYSGVLFKCRCILPYSKLKILLGFFQEKYKKHWIFTFFVVTLWDQFFQYFWMWIWTQNAFPGSFDMSHYILSKKERKFIFLVYYYKNRYCYEYLETKWTFYSS